MKQKTLNYLLLFSISIIFSKTLYAEKINTKIVSENNFCVYPNDFWDKLRYFFKAKHLHGTYREDDMRKDANGPWFFFDRDKYGTGDEIVNLRMQMDTIRIWILQDKNNYRNIYKKIIAFANESLSNCNAPEGSCPSAINAKAAAFVYVVGIKMDTINNTDTAFLFTDFEERLGYRNKVVDYLKAVDDPNLYNGWDDFAWFPGVNLAATLAMWEKMYYRSKDLLYLVEAFDLLRGAHNLDYNLEYNKDDINSMAERIIERFVVPLYRRARAGTFVYAKQNYTLVVGSALSSAGIVFHDYGTNMFNYKRMPQRWVNASYYFMHDVMWSIEGSESGQDDYYGFAEGPHYFEASFTLMLPMFRARKNFSNNQKYNPYYKSTFSLKHHAVKNFMFDENYDRLYEWYNNITTPSGPVPSYDESWSNKNFNYAFAILGDKNKEGTCSYNLRKIFLPGVVADKLMVDYLAALTPPSDFELPNAIKMASGNIVFRGKDSIGTENYMHILTENGIPSGSGHEHPDYGHFDINADNCNLIFDPPYFGEPSWAAVTPSVYHNMATINEGVSMDSIFDMPIIGSGFNNFWTNSYLCGNKLWTREFQVFRNQNIRDTSRYYYIITDRFFNSDTIPKNFRISLNGNGRSQIGSGGPAATYFRNDKYAEWNYPISKEKNWAVQASISCSNLNFNFYEDNNAKHGSADANIMSTEDGAFGYHTRLSANCYSKDSTTFTTIIAPRKVNTRGMLGKTKISTTNNINKVLIVLGENNSLFNLHIGKTNNTLDSINNPFDFDSTSCLLTNGINTSISWDTIPELVRRGCVSSTNFRAAGFTTGSKLTLNTKDYINSNSDSVFTTYYQLTSKNKYQGTFYSFKNTTVTYYLPDMEIAYFMVAKDDSDQLLNFTYDTATFEMTINFEKGMTNFNLEPADPCLTSCFFPVTADTIKGLFHFYEGTNEYLSNDLDIAKDAGQLLITHGSRMHICQNYTLVNSDSIIMKCNIGYDKGSSGGLFAANGGNEGIQPNSLNISSKVINDPSLKNQTRIIVDNNAALVLDSGSYTHVGIGCLIWIKKGGTLLIKKGATLEIGNCETDYGHPCHSSSGGMVIIDDSAFICIEDSADIHFNKLIGDTVDRNLFFISTDSNKPAKSGVNTYGASGKFEKLDWSNLPGRFVNHNCVELCSLRFVNPTDVVHNEPWGYCNYNMPKSIFNLKKYSCINDTIYLEESSRSLNETRTIIEVFQHDTLTPFRYWKGERVRLSKYEKIDFCNFDSADIYFIRVITINSCGISDTLTKSIEVLSDPISNFSMSSNEVCPGTNVFYTNYNPIPSNKYVWHVNAIDTSFNSNLELGIDNPLYELDWEIDSIQNDTFRFDDFYFYGGLKYAISLTVENSCGASIHWDTLTVKPGAFISFERPKAYANPINGVRSIQLNGHIIDADSFRWTPATWLNRTDSILVTSTPEDSISYILIVKGGNCVAYDTVTINYNHVSNAGKSDTVCYSENEILLGNSFDLSTFLGFLYYKGGVDFRNQFVIRTNTDHYYFRYLTHFMLTTEFKDWATSCGGNLYENFVNDLQRDSTFNEPWFKSYYQNLIEFNNVPMYDLDSFVNQVSLNSPLNNNYSNTGDYSTYAPCLDNFFNSYDNFLNSSLNTVSVSWLKVVGVDTSSISGLENFFVGLEYPNQSSLYIQSVITPEHAEIDEHMVFVDSVLTPLFYPQFQVDSMAIFENITLPFYGINSFEWNFGDGSNNSFEVNPIHTFPRFDSSYIVCLTAKNKCGNWTYCDTIHIDSAHLGGVYKIKSPQAKVPTESTPHIFSNNNQDYLINYPNPFNENSTVSYLISNSFQTASLEITNNTGQLIKRIPLSQNSGLIKIDGGGIANGIYHCSVIVDGKLNSTILISVMH